MEAVFPEIEVPIVILGRASLTAASSSEGTAVSMSLRVIAL
jgi:hypothetical protein